MYTHSILYYIGIGFRLIKIHQSSVDRSIISHPVPHLPISYQRAISDALILPPPSLPPFRLLNLAWQARRHATRGLNLHQLVQSACRHGTIKIQSDDNLSYPVREIPLHANRFMELCADPMDSILYSTGKYESNDDGLLEIIPSFLSKISTRKFLLERTLFPSWIIFGVLEDKISANTNIERKWYFRTALRRVSMDDPLSHVSYG